MIKGETNHNYYCSYGENGCDTSYYSSWKEYTKVKREKLLFRFDIFDSSESGLKLELHYGDDTKISGLSHDIISISDDDFSEIDIFLEKKYLELLRHIAQCRIPSTDNYYGFEETSQCYLGQEFDKDYNLVYSYHWKEQTNGLKELIVIAAKQRHGNSNWIGCVKDITPETEKKLQDVIDNVYMPYLIDLWPEYSTKYNMKDISYGKVLTDEYITEIINGNYNDTNDKKTR